MSRTDRIAKYNQLMRIEAVSYTHLNDFAGLRAQDCRVITADFIDQHSGLVFHDGKKVADEILNLAFEAYCRRKKEQD